MMKIQHQSLILNILLKMMAWFSSVLYIGGITGFLGILLAAIFGHEEIFVWPGICLGAVIGGVIPLFDFFSHRKNASTDNDYYLRFYNDYQPHESVQSDCALRGEKYVGEGSASFDIVSIDFIELDSFF